MKRPRIMLVDDEPETLALFRAAFARKPYDVTCCGSGAEALRQFFAALSEGWCYDAFVLDCAMPHFDAFTIARIVRLAEKTGIVHGCATRIGIFTAYPQTVERSTLMQESGIDRYWRKPEDVLTLGRHIAEWLGVELHDSISPDEG